jgi:hypothetical protein
MRFYFILFYTLIIYSTNVINAKPVVKSTGFLNFNSTNYGDSTRYFWHTNFLGTKLINKNPKNKTPIIIAIIDDGFRISHSDIEPFIYHNPNESINLFDDDGNGYKDDCAGWDISDNDDNVLPSKDKLKQYYHGTYISGIIANLLKTCYGTNASNYFKLLPIKALEDKSEKTYLKDGYKAIAYAIKMKATIICCAWGSNVISTEEKEILQKAIDAGIIILSSGGNFNNSLDHYPGAYDGVIAVGATDSLNKKVDVSNFGKFIDISAPGKFIYGASSLNESDYIIQHGTSPSVAIVTAAAAILKLNFEKKSSLEIEEILKGTSVSIDSLNPTYAGRLGAGVVNFKHIIDFIENDKTNNSVFNSHKTEGFISFTNNKKDLKKWAITPYGANLGIEFNLEQLAGDAKDGVFKFKTKTHAPIELKLNEWLKQKTFIIDSKQVDIEFIPNKASKKTIGKISYQIIPIDSTILYCKDKLYYTELSDSIEDGSGEFNYANNCDCKWIITVPVGYRISVSFQKFDTEAQIDNVYLYDGEYAIPEYAISRFSGPDIPPSITSRTNKVLVWFVTNPKYNGKGWKLIYKAVN